MPRSGSALGQPGIKSDRTSSPRRVLLTRNQFTLIPNGVVVNGSESRDPGNSNDVDVLRPGVVLGLRTSDSKYAPSIIGTLSQDYSSGTTLNVSTAVATEVERRITTSGTLRIRGPGTDSGNVNTETASISSIDTSAGTITLSGALSNNYVDESFLQADDGSQTPICLVPDGDMIQDVNGLKVTDQDDANIDRDLSQPLIGGYVDASQIVNYPSDSGTLQDWLKLALNGTILDAGSVSSRRGTQGTFIFDDDQ